MSDGTPNVLLIINKNRCDRLTTQFGEAWLQSVWLTKEPGSAWSGYNALSSNQMLHDEIIQNDKIIELQKKEADM